MPGLLLLYSKITWKALQQQFGKCQKSPLQPLVLHFLLRLACPLSVRQRNTRQGCITISVSGSWKLLVKMRFPTTADVAHKPVRKRTHTCANGGNVKNSWSSRLSVTWDGYGWWFLAEFCGINKSWNSNVISTGTWSALVLQNKSSELQKGKKKELLNLVWSYYQELLWNSEVSLAPAMNMLTMNS